MYIVFYFYINTDKFIICKTMLIKNKNTNKTFKLFIIYSNNQMKIKFKITNMKIFKFLKIKLNNYKFN